MDQNGRAPASAATRLIAGGSEIDVILNVQRSAIKARGERLDAMLDKRILSIFIRSNALPIVSKLQRSLHFPAMSLIIPK